ncbi:MAG: four helix bundle protein [Parcubacteria group bacterium]|nr:four helix bundle protein [Parcubacteria group bacterium]
MNPKKQNLREDVERKADEYAHAVYKFTKKFPKDEVYGITSQLRRSATSVPINLIEGYARAKESPKTYTHFIWISYGSLKESQYILSFSFKEGYLIKEELDYLDGIANQIGAMLWTLAIKS